MTKEFDVPIIFDATHCVQKPGGKGNSSDGDKANFYVPTQKQLESFATDVIYDDSSTPIQLVVQTSTGTVYGTYEVAITQARFDLAPGTEDRFSFSMTFVAKDRQDS